MDAREVLDKKIDDYRRRWSEFTLELNKELERLEWLADTLGVPLPSLPRPPDAEETPKVGVAVKPGQFFSMSQPDAVAAYLTMVRRPCTLDELLDVLQQGGIVFNSKDPRGTLYTQLIRATMRFVKLPTGQFDLLERYPNEVKRRKFPKKHGRLISTPGDETDEEEGTPEKG